MTDARPQCTVTSAARVLTILLLCGTAFGSTPVVDDLLKNPLWVQVGDGTRIDVGEEQARRYLSSGFHENEREPGLRSFVWAEHRAIVDLWLTRPCDRVVYINTRAIHDGMRVQLIVNGNELEKQTLDHDWTTLRWLIPAQLLHAGRNEAVLTSQETDTKYTDSRSLAMCLDWIDVLLADDDDRACAASRSIGDDPTAPVVLPGVELHLPYRDRPRKVVQLAIEGREGASIDAYIRAKDRGVDYLLYKGVTPSAGTLNLPYDSCCQNDTQIRLVATGTAPATIRQLTVSGSESQMSWRTATGLLALEIAVAVALLALATTVVRGDLPLPWPARPWLDLVLVAAVALLFRLVVIAFYPHLDQSRFGDSWEYLQKSQALASGQVPLLSSYYWHMWSTWIRPPGYFLFLAAIFALKGSISTIVLIHLLLSTMTAVLVYLLAFQLFSRRAALLSGLLFALYLEPAVHVTIVQSETLYMALFTTGLLCIAALSARRSPPLWLALVGGIAFGLAGVVRSGATTYVMGAAALLVVARGWRFGLAVAATTMFGVALVTGPVVVRNSILAGHVMGVHNITGAGWLIARPPAWLLKGIDPDNPVKDSRFWDRVKRANKDNAMARTNFVRDGLIDMAKHPGPAWTRFQTQLKENLSPFVPAYIHTYLRERRPVRAIVLLDLLNGVYLATLVFGIAGMLLYVRDPHAWPVMFWIVLLSVTVPLVFYPDQMQGRFRFPVLPAAMTFAGAAIDHLLLLPSLIRGGTLPLSAKGLLEACSARVRRA